MGYYANFSGVVTLKENITVEQINDILKEYFSDIDIDINSPQDNYFRINGFEKYSKESYEEFYKKITPFVSFGTIKFSGEGGDCWKHSFKNGVWEEYSGKIVYDKKPSMFYDSNKDNKEDDLEL